MSPAQDRGTWNGRLQACLFWLKETPSLPSYHPAALLSEQMRNELYNHQLLQRALAIKWVVLCLNRTAPMSVILIKAADLQLVFFQRGPVQLRILFMAMAQACLSASRDVLHPALCPVNKLWDPVLAVILTTL